MAVLRRFSVLDIVCPHDGTIKMEPENAKRRRECWKEKAVPGLIQE